MNLSRTFRNAGRVLPVAAAVLIAGSTAGAQQYVLVQPGTARTTAVQPTTYVTRPVAQPVSYVTQPAATQAVAQPAATQAVAGDPYGFLNWLNATRAQHGLRAVGYDQNLANWAAQNSSHQASRGSVGHFVMGPARRQNSAMGNSASIGAMWMASPAHRAALLDPTISFIGIAGAGAYWTYNAY